VEFFLSSLQKAKGILDPFRIDGVIHFRPLGEICRMLSSALSQKHFGQIFELQLLP
jgi:hypothetical protein